MTGRLLVTPAPAPKSQSQNPSSAPSKNDSASGEKNTTPSSPAGQRLAALLRDEILRNKPDAKITDAHVANWSQVADRIIRLDKRNEERIAAVIRWAQTDDFWMSNALSMKTIREKFDQLELKAGAKRNGRAAVVGVHQPLPPEPTREWLVPEDVDLEAGKKLWEDAKEKIRQKVSRIAFDTWLHPTRSLGLGKKALYVQLPAENYARDMDRFDAALREVLPDRDVKFIAPTLKAQEVSCA